MNKLKKRLRRSWNTFNKTNINPLLNHPNIQWITSKLTKRNVVYSLFVLAMSLYCWTYIYNPSPSKETVLNKLDAVTFMVESGTGTGTGTLFSRRDNKGDLVHFIWTAGHVVERLKVGPDENMVVQFKPVKVTKIDLVGGVRVDKASYVAHVIKFSGIKGGDDLALLELEDKNVFKENDSTVFSGPQLVKPGTFLYHVGCMFGESGYNSISEGILANNGRIIYGKVFDQTSTTVFPGSSGGGVFDSRGEYVGMVTMMRQANMNFIIPMRRIMTWAKENHLEWALNKSVYMPMDYVRHNMLIDSELDSEFEQFRYFMLERWKKSLDIQGSLMKQIEQLRFNLESLRKELGKTNVIEVPKSTNSHSFFFFLPGGEDDDEDN